MSRSSRPRRAARAASDADVVVVHSSDIHVDDGYTARAHGGDGAAPLRRVLDAALGVRADVVLLTGDIFEHNRLPLELLDRVAGLLHEVRLPVVVLPGNHDPAIPDSVWHRGGVADPDNVHVLGVTHDQAVTFPELDLEIWGHAHRDYEDMAPLRAPRLRSTRWQIAAAHGHYEKNADPETALRPSWLISAEEIAATGADYVALGHWNRPVKVAGHAGVPAYYSGSPDLARTVNVVRFAASGAVTVRRRAIDWPEDGE